MTFDITHFSSFLYISLSNDRHIHTRYIRRRLSYIKGCCWEVQHLNTVFLISKCSNKPLKIAHAAAAHQLYLATGDSFNSAQEE